MAEQRKAELAAQLALARRDISLGKDRVSTELHPGHQLKKSVQNHPLGWFAGTMGAATLLGLLVRRRSRSESPKKRFRILRWTFGTGLALARPAIGRFVIARIKDEAAKRLQDGSMKSMLGGPPQK